MQVVYHYTSAESVDRIIRSGRIRESPLSDKDAFYGAGVYLTTMSPEVGRMRIAHNNWGRFGSEMEDMGKVDRAIQLWIPQRNLVQAQSKGRDIWVHRGDVVLSNYRYSVLNLDGGQEGGSWCSIL
ncbi:uncharacterized protein LOC143290565 [Babylonia areolata]|uniref:uncharacterized protein LOC143290565 n=1 Tax=Babylonia areolata TaxID=304850 RepID=UPI003FD639D3